MYCYFNVHWVMSPRPLSPIDNFWMGCVDIYSLMVTRYKKPLVYIHVGFLLTRFSLSLTGTVALSCLNELVMGNDQISSNFVDLFSFRGISIAWIHRLNILINYKLFSVEFHKFDSIFNLEKIFSSVTRGLVSLLLKTSKAGNFDGE